MAVYDIEAVAALQAEGTWRGAGFDRQDEAATWWSAGFHADEAQRWASASRYFFRTEPEPVASNHAVFAAMAQSFKAADFTPEQMRLWRDALDGVDVKATLHEARRWRAAGFAPDETARWRRWGLLTGERDLEFAVLFANAGWTWDDVAALTLLSRDRGSETWDDARRAWVAFPPAAALNYVKAGVAPEHARMFEQLGLQPQALDLELRARYEALPALDPYLAMHLNDVLDRMSAGRPDVPRPFYAEHIHDVRDDSGNGAVADGHAQHPAGAGPEQPPALPPVVDVTDDAPVHAGPVQVEAAPVEEASAESAPVEAVHAEPVHAEPVHAEPIQLEPMRVEPVEAQTMAVEVVPAEPVHAQAAQPVHAALAQHVDDEDDDEYDDEDDDPRGGARYDVQEPQTVDLSQAEQSSRHGAPVVVNLNGASIFQGTQEQARGSMAEALTGEIPVRAAWPFPRKTLPGMS